VIARRADQTAGARRLRGRRFLTAAALAVVLIAAILCGAAYAYAVHERGIVASGIRVGSVDVGGLSAAAARAKLERALRPLSRPVVLRSPRGRLVLSAHRLKLSLGAKAAIDRALAVGRRGSFLTRAWRGVTGGRLDVNLQPQIRYSDVAVTRTIEDLQRQIDRVPRDAAVLPSPDGLRLTEGHRGLAVAADLLRREVTHVLSSRTAAREIRVPLRHPRPRVTIAALRRRYASYITIDRARFTLRVYDHLRLVRSYPIAVGQVGLQTPAGLYHIQDKVVNPSWQVPFSSWTGSLAGKLIPPGPEDPLKARWLGIFNGAGIHGTDETWSIGHAVSHGCVRMTIPDVIDLYDRVSVGTPVYIGD
jgi:lipoprotein-anchoring transpeptidase ErfK/SrfK